VDYQKAIVASAWHISSSGPMIPKEQIFIYGGCQGNENSFKSKE